MNLTVIPDYPDYAMDETGEVYRITTASRGRTAGVKNLRVTPVCHPKGNLWYVQMRDSTNTRKRVRLDKLREMMKGLDASS